MRKKWSAKTDITPDLLKSREKRKWQVALRRYVLEKNPSVFYAPYFGLDIENIRSWFENQFVSGIGWGDFAQKWQLDHIIPVTYFDFSKEDDLRCCWNFTNLRICHFEEANTLSAHLNLFAAKKYFKALHDHTKYSPCLKMLEKLEHIENSEIISSKAQQAFIKEKSKYLEKIKTYSSFEFQLLNNGQGIEQVEKEMSFLKKFDK